MAIYHLNAKTLGRSQGRSATGAAAYRAAACIADARTGLIFDYTRKRGVDGAEILTPDGSTLERAALWNAVEQAEKRTDAQVAREVEVALPHELLPEQMRELVRGFVREQFTSAGMVADVAFHHLTGDNPHAHIMLTMREWRAEGFGLKRREWNDRALCEQWRERWASHANDALARAGHVARIDHRTLAEQAATALDEGRHADAIALDRAPTLHERGSPTVAAHNAGVKADAAQRRAAWEAIELAAMEQGRFMPEATDTAPRSRAEKAAALDQAFIASMRGRKDDRGRRWRSHDERAQEEATWLASNGGGDTRRLRALDRAQEALAAMRERRDRWREEHPRPPLWRFWERPRWRREKIEAQAPVEQAKRAAAKAEQRASPQAITAWRQAYADHQTEYAAAVAARRACALLPSEEARAEAARQEAKRKAQAAMSAQRPGQGVQPLPTLPRTPTRPRPGRR